MNPRRYPVGTQGFQVLLFLLCPGSHCGGFSTLLLPELSVRTRTSAPNVSCLVLRMPRWYHPLCSLHCHTDKPMQWGDHHSPCSVSQPVTGPPARLLIPLCLSVPHETAASSSVCSLLPQRVWTVQNQMPCSVPYPHHATSGTKARLPLQVQPKTSLTLTSGDLTTGSFTCSGKSESQCQFRAGLPYI